MGKIKLKININDVFGLLTVVEEVDKKEGYCTYYWKCLCSCGKERTIAGRYLVNGKIENCGCVRKTSKRKINFKDITGQRSGSLVFISYQGKSRWLCQCDCGKTTEIATPGIRTTRSCGECKSIVGMKYGRLLVLEYTDKIKCLCRCDCGVEKEIYRNALKDGSVKSCGCLARERCSDIQINQRFEKLVCLERVQNDDNNNIVWKCQCDCGNIAEVRASNLLKKGGTKSCGCYVRMKVPEGVLNNTFGILTPLKYLGNQKWLCRCDCSTEVTRKTKNLVAGITTHCGCLRQNKNNTSTHQQCITCKEIKLLHKNYFGKDKKEKYGFRTECSNCRRNKRTNTQWLNVCLQANTQRDRRKGQEYNIDLPFLKEFLKEGTKCIYCNYSGRLGLDRIDNTLGHLKDNVLPCCEECNRTRSNKLTVEQMKLIGPVLGISKGLLKGQTLKECVELVIERFKAFDSSVGVIR